MKRRLVSILIAAVLSASLLTGCQSNTGSTPNKVTEFGQIENEQDDKNPSEDKPTNVSLPTYDPQNATQPLSYKSDRKIEIKGSYYKEQLASRPRRAFDALYSAASNMSSSIELEPNQQITPDELKNVMHILFLDCPELFWLDTEYSYTTYTNTTVDPATNAIKTTEYVNKVMLSFDRDASAVQSLKDSIARDKPNILKQVAKNDYDSISNIVNKVIKTNHAWGSVSYGYDGTLDLSCTKPFDKDMERNSIGISKEITYWLRECGIECTVAVGEPVSDTLDDYELVTDYLPFEEFHSGDGVYTMRFNYTCYWMWNLVKIDDKWYNLDWTYSYLLNETVKSHYSLRSLWFATDLLMSQTRLSYMNEEILGMTPSCTDINFLSYYRSGNYILPLTETQALLKIQDILGACNASNSTDVTYQCANEETFNYIVKHFDEQVENYNKTTGNSIGAYKTQYVRDDLVIKVYDIIHNF